MQVTCEKCSAKYNIADDKIKSTGTSVKCPKCQAVFKVFPASAGGESVACANCGKNTPAVPGMAVVFCEDCKQQLADSPPAGGDEPDLFAGANLFGSAAPAKDDDNLFGDATANTEFPAAPAAAPAPAPEGLFDDAPSAPSGGGLFDDPPAPASGDDLFGDTPAAPKAAGGGLFDDEPSPASGGGLFDDEESAASSGGGLFDDSAPAAPAAAADPFGDFDAPPGNTASASSADPFAEFGDGGDDMGFQEPAPAASEPAPDFDDAGETADSSEDEAFSGPVREKEAPKFKKKDVTTKDRILDFFSENGSKIGMIGGGSFVGLFLILLITMALLPGFYNARPTRPDDAPGFFSRNAFALQKTLKTKYYGRAMEEAYLKAGAKDILAWTGAGFAAAETEYKELLVFDPANQKAKAALVELYAIWDLVEEKRIHTNDIAKLSPGAGTLAPTTSARVAFLNSKPAELKGLLPKLGAQEKLYSGYALQSAGDVTGAVQEFTAYANANPTDFLGEMALAAILRDTKQYALAVTHYEKANAVVNGNAKARLEIGKLYYGPLADHEKAMASLNMVLSPQLGASSRLKAEAQYYMAHILHRRGAGPQALASIQGALSVEGSNPAYLTTLGDLYFDSGKIVDAYTAYEKASIADKTYVKAFIGLGRANERLEKLPAALENYKQAITIDPVNIRANFLYAALILGQGRKEEAEKVLRSVLDRDPKNIEAHDQLAKFYVEQGKSNEAIAEYGKVIELAPGQIEGFVGIGAVLLDQGKVAEAKLRFQQAATIDTNNPSVLYRLGQAAYLEGDTKTASESLQKALSKDPYDWEAHLYLGMTYFKQKNYAAALQEYQKTIDVNQRAGEAFRQRALVYLAQGSALEGKPAAELLDKAVDQMEQALYFVPNVAEYYYDYGLCLNASGKAGKAKDAWLKAKELKPGYKEAMFSLAQYYVSFTDYSNAENILKEVLKTSPKDGQAYLEMGKVYFSKEMLDEAQRAFSKAVQLEPKSAEALNFLGEVTERKGLSNESTPYFKRALAIDPNFGIAYFNLGLYWKDRNPAKSKEMFKAALETKTLSKEKAEEVQIQLRELEFIK